MGIDHTATLCYGVPLSDENTEFLGTLTFDEMDEHLNSLHDDLDFATFGSDGNGYGYIICLQASLYSVGWTEIANVDGLMRGIVNFDTGLPDAIAEMKKFCEKYEIPFEPKWYLSSYMG